MKWAEMIINNENSVIKSLQARTNALATVRKIGSFKVRKLIANGIFLSRLSYLLAVFGGTEEYLLTSLQRMQNRAAREVCNRGKRYPATKALEEVGWLPVRKLVEYHSLLQAKKTWETTTPSYLYRKLVRNRDNVEPM